MASLGTIYPPGDRHEISKSQIRTSRGNAGTGRTRCTRQHARDGRRHRLYAGVNVGQSRAKIDDARITSNLLGGGFATPSIVNDDTDTGYKLFGGYKFNRNFAVEGGYFDLGRFGFTATTVPAGTLNGSIKLRGVNLDAVGILPITEKFSAFGRVGVNYAEARDSFSGTGAVTVTNPNPSKRDTNVKFGAGLQYDFTQSLGCASRPNAIASTTPSAIRATSIWSRSVWCIASAAKRRNPRRAPWRPSLSPPPRRPSP